MVERTVEYYIGNRKSVSRVLAVSEIFDKYFELRKSIRLQECMMHLWNVLHTRWNELSRMNLMKWNAILYKLDDINLME